MEEQLLKSEEVARILHVSRSFAYLLMKRGDIPTVRIGTAVRVRPQDLDQYIQKRASENEAVMRLLAREQYLLTSHRLAFHSSHFPLQSAS